MGSLYMVPSLINYISIVVNINLHLCFLLPLCVYVCVRSCVNDLCVCDFYAHILRECMYL